MSEELPHEYTYKGKYVETLGQELERMRVITYWYKKQLAQSNYLSTADPIDLAMFQGISDAYEAMYHSLRRLEPSQS